MAALSSAVGAFAPTGHQEHRAAQRVSNRRAWRVLWFSDGKGHWLALKRLLLPSLALLASIAAAQSDPSASAGSAGSATLGSLAPATWNAEIRQTFFTDETAMYLLPAADIRAKWSALSPENQRIAQQDCDAAQAGSIGGAATGGDAKQAPASPRQALRPSAKPSQPGAAGSAVAAGDLSLSHLVRICAIIDQRE